MKVHDLSWRFLWHDVHVTTNDRSVFAILRRMWPEVDQEALAPMEELGLRVVHHRGGYQVWCGGSLLAAASTDHEAASIVFAHVQRTAFEGAAGHGWMRVHGLVANRSGRRLVAVGPSGVGKTTLALALLASGWDVGGDESFITRGGRCLAVPRRFQVKPGRPVLSDRASRWIREADWIPQFPRVRLVDPSVAHPWRLTVGLVDDLVLLARTEGRSRLRRAQTSEALEAMRSEIFLTVDDPSTVARELGALVGAARLLHLSIGSDGDAVALVERCATGTPI